MESNRQVGSMGFVYDVTEMTLECALGVFLEFVVEGGLDGESAQLFLRYLVRISASVSPTASVELVI